MFLSANRYPLSPERALSSRLQCGGRLSGDRAEIVHRVARAFDQGGCGRAQRPKGALVETAEEQIVDGPDLAAGTIDLEPAGRRETEQHAAAIVRIALLED